MLAFLHLHLVLVCCADGHADSALAGGGCQFQMIVCQKAKSSLRINFPWTKKYTLPYPQNRVHHRDAPREMTCAAESLTKRKFVSID